MRFAVWAPDADTVHLLVQDARVPMTKDSGGWWSVVVPTAGPGTDYRFVVDGGEPRPDPRSPWQPDGVHGPSRVVDHGAFAWHDAGWQAPPLEAGVIYELHVGTFTPAGTFDAAIDRLEHLLALGVTHVELMPVHEFPGTRGWGYDGVDLYAPHHVYGGPDGLKRLVDACHARGLAVLLDVVYNHLGPSGNYLGVYGPYFTDRYGTPWGRAVNLDCAGSDEVRRFFCDNALMWLRDYHFDGLRIDAVHAIMDTSAVHFLEQMAEEVDELETQTGRRLVLIAESDLNDPRIIRPPEMGGYGLDAQWSDDFHHALHAVLTGERLGYYADFGRLADLAAAFERAFVYDGRYSAHRRRRHGRRASGLSGHRFVVCQQNHDQVGNRPTGDRIGHLAGIRRQKIGAALLLTSPFVPLLFQGEEWGASTPFLYFTDHAEPDLGRAVTEGRCREFEAFGWTPVTVPDPQAPETFLRSRLDWTELSRQPHVELLEWYRTLIRVRRTSPSLLDGRLDRVRSRFDEAARWFVVERTETVTVCNLADRAQRIPCEVGSSSSVLAASDTAVTVTPGGLNMPPESVIVLRRHGV